MIKISKLCLIHFELLQTLFVLLSCWIIKSHQFTALCMLSLSPFQLHSVLKTQLIFLSLACPVSRVRLCPNTQTNRNSDNESISLMNEVSPDSATPLKDYLQDLSRSNVFVFLFSFRSIIFQPSLTHTVSKWPQLNLMSETFLRFI